LPNGASAFAARPKHHAAAFAARERLAGTVSPDNSAFIARP